MGGKEAGSVTNPLFESMEGMLRQLSQGSGAAGKSGAEVKVWGGAWEGGGGGQGVRGRVGGGRQRSRCGGAHSFLELPRAGKGGSEELLHM